MRCIRCQLSNTRCGGRDEMFVCAIRACNDIDKIARRTVSSSSTPILAKKLPAVKFLYARNFINRRIWTIRCSVTLMSFFFFFFSVNFPNRKRCSVYVAFFFFFCGEFISLLFRTTVSVCICCETCALIYTQRDILLLIGLLRKFQIKNRWHRTPIVENLAANFLSFPLRCRARLFYIDLQRYVFTERLSYCLRFHDHLLTWKIIEIVDDRVCSFRLVAFRTSAK